MNTSEKQRIYDKVAETLDKVRPYLQSDGGDIELVELTDDMVVKVRLKGACHGCPFSQQTMKMGVEQSIRKEIPQIKEVIAI